MAENWLDRSKDADLDQLVRELSSRAHGNKRRSLRLMAWKFTVQMSYIVKRFTDIVVSALAMVVLSPLFLLIAIAVKATSRGPVIFTQIRVGRYGRHFKFYKFRSMVQNAESQKETLQAQNESADGVIFKMKEDPRITKVGRFIRQYSIDELPQLINILKGDCSIVGPRAIVPTKEFNEHEKQRHIVQPGLTCYWQTMGRTAIPWEEWVELDLDYIQDMSLLTDAKLIADTLPVVFSGSGE